MFNTKFYSNNRERLIKLLPNALILVPAHVLVQNSADESYPFRQDSSFWYLTGLNEPNLLLVIDTTTKESMLLLPVQSEYEKEWDGVHDESELVQSSGITQIRSKVELPDIVKQAKKKKLNIYYPFASEEVIEPYGIFANPARRMLERSLVENGLKKDKLFDVRASLARLRMIKQPEEIAAIKRAIEITGETLAKVKKNLSSYTSEIDIERQLTAGFVLGGANGHAFEPIVASGLNAATIHYRKNTAALSKHDLVLLDVGASYDGYAADISRVWSIDGTPTKRQEELYAACLEIQEFAISELRAGVLLREYQEKVEVFAQEIFVKHGAMSMVDKRFPHGISHFLGLDTHDAGIYDEPLPENAIITVEPGIYLPEENIGIRVEDDVLITRNGIKNLSAHIPREL